MPTGIKANKQPLPHLKALADLINRYLAREGISVRELNQRIGLPRNDTVSYRWVAAQAAPSRKNLSALAKLLGVEEDELRPGGNPRPYNNGLPRVPRRDSVTALEAHLVASPSARAVTTLPPSQKAQDVLSYGADSDGNAVVRLIARGPHSRMGPIFRFLMDAGLVPNGEEEE